MRDQIPLAADKRRILMTEFMSIKAPADAKGIRNVMLEIERIIDQWERLADKEFDEEAKVGIYPQLHLEIHRATSARHHFIPGARSARPEPSD